MTYRLTCVHYSSQTGLCSLSKCIPQLSVIISLDVTKS